MDYRRYISTYDRKPSVSYVQGWRFSGVESDTVALPATIKVTLHQKGKPQADLEPNRERRNPVKTTQAFGWGENTPEACQLAYTIIRQAGVSESRAKAAYVSFTEEVIAMLKDWRWVIALKDVKTWVKGWEDEQAHIRRLEAARPKAIAPRSLPFYGVMEENLLPCAYKRVQAFLAIAPPDPNSYAAMLHLELAANLAEARRKTVNSIYWGNANAQARNDVWLQLLLMESQILFNLNKFGDWWDRYTDTLEAADVGITFPLPDYLSPETAALVNYQAHQWTDLISSIRDLREFAVKAQTRQDQYQPFLLKHQQEAEPFDGGIVATGGERLVSDTPPGATNSTGSVGTGVQT